MLEISSGGSAGPGEITFSRSTATVKLDAAPVRGSTFADALKTFGAKASVSGGKLTVTSGATNESFTLSGTPPPAFALGSDAAGGLAVNGAPPAPR